MQGREDNLNALARIVLCAVMAMIAMVSAVLAGLGVPVSAPQPLNTNAATDSGLDREPQIAAGSNGRWIAVWESSENFGGNIGTDYDILAAVSSDYGGSWSPPFVLNSNASADAANNDTTPSISTDGNGVWIAAWEGRDTLGGTVNSSINLFYSRSDDDGETWSPVAALNTNASSDDGADRNPHLYYDGTSDWIAVWQSTSSLVGTIGNDSDILIARSSDSGGSWTDPLPLNTTASTDGSATDIHARLATAGAGRWIAVWQSNNTLGGTNGSDYDILFSTSINNAMTWTPPAALNSNAGGPNAENAEPVIATDADGMWIVAWTSLDSLGGTIGTDRDILYSRSMDDGVTWSPAAPLHSNADTDAGEDHSPSITTDRNDRWAVVWHSTENLNGNIGTDGDILIVFSDDNGMTWSDPAAFNTNAGSDSGADAFAVIATDDAGAWCAAWQADDTGGGTFGAELDVATARFAIPDCNLNTVPDISEVDCNANDVPDDCDIASGFSDDLDRNGIPDECDVPPSPCTADLAPGAGDEAVGVPDLLFVINAWGPCANPRNCTADIAPEGPPIGDDVVGVPDLLFIINNWGPCP